MAASQRSIEQLVTPSVLGQAKTVRLKRRADQARRATLSGLARARDLAQPVRVRLNAPLIGPPRFGTAGEYRRWKAHRSARPRLWNALQWPLGVWFLIGVALTVWVKSVLT